MKSRKRKNKTPVIVESILFVLMLAATVFIVKERGYTPDTPAVTPSPVITASPIPDVTPTPEITPSPTPEPEPEYFTFSFIGDCTICSHQKTTDYEDKMNGDYSYPFKNTVSYFESDDLTVANLECTISEKVRWSADTFYFQTKPEALNIFLEGGVDFVTTANNHMDDFGQDGADDTYASLEQFGIPYGKENEAQIITVGDDLKVGIYCAGTDLAPSQSKAIEGIESLKKQGADYIICAFHWGQELQYTPSQSQINLAHASIDAGADVVYGSHPHVLQPIEEYGNGLILYSMSNWTFGGSTSPSDADTAIVQVKVKRDIDGSISTDGFDVIPCGVSSDMDGIIQHDTSKGYYYNDYCPTPYEKDFKHFDLVMQKLSGEFEGSLQVDYTGWYASYADG